jgi:hypothetical protein
VEILTVDTKKKTSKKQSSKGNFSSVIPTRKFNEDTAKTAEQSSMTNRDSLGFDPACTISDITKGRR